MKVVFVQYPKCSTCVKARKWLEEQGVEFTSRNIVEENPSAEELKEWAERGNLEVKKFFNTSGMIYKEEGIKEKRKTMTKEEQFALLGERGMLVKRPILVTDQGVKVGFKEEEWKKLLG